MISKTYLNHYYLNTYMDIDYNKLGFKCGLEIHQQLEGNKLFCSCPTLNSDKEADVKFERRLRAVAGETGRVDVAAKHEMEKGKKFLYEANSSDTCLIEYDEQPPKELNRQALDTAIKVALLLNAKIIDEIQVMRKTVVDGSDVSGFQRTALVAVDGHINTSLGKINIPTICLEEEAAQKLEENNGYVAYRLDRLGIPLIEIATDASIKNNEHAKEVAAYIGMVLRSVGVKRGLGTIRQDVNVSLEKGARTEIKGFQDLKSMPKVIDIEIHRQLDAIKQGKKINREVRKVEKDFSTSFLRPMPGAARLYPETDVLRVKLDKNYIKELKLPKLLKHKEEDLEKKYKITKELAKELIGNDIFEDLIKKYNKIKPQIIAHILIDIPKEIKTRFKEDISKLGKEHFEEILGYLDKGKIAKEAIIDLLIKKIKNEKIKLEGFTGISEKDIEKEVTGLIDRKKGLNIGAYMGILMGKYRGKVDGKKIMELLRKFLK